MAATSSKVSITVTVEVTPGDTYGDDWKLGDLREQVKREAVQMLRNELSGKLVRIIGEPTVNVIRMEEKP